MKHIWDTPAWPDFTYDAALTEVPLAQATQAIGEVAGLKAGLEASDLEVFNRKQVVQEALSTFEIEGVTLNAEEIEASVIASLNYRDNAAFGRRSDAIVALMLAARASDKSLDASTLRDWHRMLFHGIEVEDLGRWRSFDIEIVRSAAAGSRDVLYKGPPPETLDAEMAELLAWLASDVTQALPIRAAIAHLWFESIHPFSDGNGRIGRAIIEHIFAASLPLPFSLSRQIERDKRGYYAALQEGRKKVRNRIDATPFVVWFLNTLTAAANAAKGEAQFLVRRNQLFVHKGDALNARQVKALQTLFAQGEPRVALGLTAKSYRKMTKTSGPTATRDLGAMERAGVLKRSDAGGRATHYTIIY